MRRIILLASFCFVYLIIKAQNTPIATTYADKSSNSMPAGFNVTYQSSDLINYVRTYAFNKEYLEAPSGDSLDSAIVEGNIMQSTTYLDGMGRPIQQVDRRVLPDGAGGYSDMVQFMLYDEYGRQVYQPMAYRSANVHGGMDLSPGTNLLAFMRGSNSNPDGHFPKEDVFYGETVYESSPLNRVTKQMAPGNSWAGSGKGVTIDWRGNNASDGVRRWTSEPSSASSPGVYANNTLKVTITTDEEENQVREFTDKLGRVVLKRVQKAGSTADARANWLSTYYVYDDYGNLTYVIPPRAEELLSDNSWDWAAADINALIFQYTYDGRNRMETKKVPGGGRVDMVYDKLDRLVLTQDANQRSATPSEWMFTKYDAFNRPVLTGIINTSKTRQTLQGELNTWAGELNVQNEALQTEGVEEVLNGSVMSISNRNTSVDIYRTKSGGYIEFLPGFESETGAEFETQRTLALGYEYTAIQGYHDASFPLLKDYEGDYELLSISYYDDYDFTSKSYLSSHEKGFYSTGGTNLNNAVDPNPHNSAKGLATGSKIKVLGTTSDWLTTVMYYDDRGRVIQTIADNHVGGEDRTTTQYDFSGKVLNTYTTHTNPQANSNTSTIIAKRYTYDNAGRLETVSEALNQSNPSNYTTLVTNTYNELGELEDKNLGNDLETLTYDYNIRGWLKSINGDYVASGTGNHYFGMDLSYDNGFTQNQLNGNIAGVKWRSASDSKQRAYGFDYDASNRLLAADYTQYGTSWNNTAADFSTDYTYDANGNIKTLQRKGMVLGNVMTIDNLQYDYGEGFGVNGRSNTLKRVRDNSAAFNIGDFKDGTNTGNDYAYDANGNMTQDLNKDIQGGHIDYNHLNLPAKVTFEGSSAKTITYTYDAAGIKLAKTVNNGGNITTTDYIGGFIYQNNDLQHFGHEEGRVRKNHAGALVYDYFIKDHLGNTRMTLTEETNVVNVYKATMESESDTDGNNIAAFEEQYFYNLDAVRSSAVSAANHSTIDDDGCTNCDESALTNSTNRIGQAIMLNVMAGDVIDLEVFAYFDNLHTTNTSSIGATGLGTLATNLAMAFVPNGSTEAINQAKSLFNVSDGRITEANTQSSTTPFAYLNYMVFDSEFNFIPSKSDHIQVAGASGKQKLDLPGNLSITQKGYIYIWVSNESNDNISVYWDDLKVTHTKGQILQEDHYYPFGMNIQALSSTAPLSKPNQFKYNGKELNEEFDLGWYSYGTRNYDPQLGRWMIIDPAADLMAEYSPYNYVYNNPLKYIDPDGSIPWPIRKLFRFMVRKKRPDGFFGEQRGARLHLGIDLNYESNHGGNFDRGADVLATHGGKVIQVKKYNTHTNGAGTYVKIQGPNGEIQTVYMHLDNVTVEENDAVEEGQVIGTLGRSGKGSKVEYTAHLHYEIRVKDSEGNFVQINPWGENRPIDPQVIIDNTVQGTIDDLNSDISVTEGGINATEKRFARREAKGKAVTQKARDRLQRRKERLKVMKGLRDALTELTGQ
ncbi:DUF6443 domain-containing protein [uncultured Roseivirga sp.]|uniref:DUF6443 domain-containing protein n=1 Tax=uncultured Roseivirga sp. TaxID=543088 RepID=UPI000D7AA134|nr:DUF6443 domain-containing protein [uncultured Roseivirga sp.]PWL30064.1 MAG: hypothetical protein DCO95_09530 [Roseivirga sp. XM-24bin3]